MFTCLSECKCFEDHEEILNPSGSTKDYPQSQDTVGLLKRIAREDHRYRDEEHKKQKELQRRTEEARDLKRAEDEARRQSQEMAQQVRDLQKAFKEEQAHYEELRRQRELLELTAQAKDEEGRRVQEERERWLRKNAVLAFLKEHGFTSVTSSKKVMMKTTFPLHVAAEAGNVRMVDMLVKEGADPDQKNSAGKTAAQAAQAAQAKKGGLDDAHDDVINILAGQGSARIVGQGRARVGGA